MKQTIETLIRRTSIILVLCGAAPLAAQPAPAANESAAGEPARKTLYELITAGGYLMIPIVLCSLVILTFALERLISLRRRRTSPDDLLLDLYELMPIEHSGQHRASASAFLSDSSCVLGNILQVGVEKIRYGFALAQTHIEEATLKEVHLMKRRLRPFSIVAQVAPLLGLLGTIYGMILCFQDAATADAASRANTLAEGIYKALVTTAAGLTVAIPAMLLYHYFKGRVDRVIDQLEEHGTDFLEHYFKFEEPARVDGRSADPQAERETQMRNAVRRKAAPGETAAVKQRAKAASTGGLTEDAEAK